MTRAGWMDGHSIQPQINDGALKLSCRANRVSPMILTQALFPPAWMLTGYSLYLFLAIRISEYFWRFINTAFPGCGIYRLFLGYRLISNVDWEPLLCHPSAVIKPSGSIHFHSQTEVRHTFAQWCCWLSLHCFYSGSFQQINSLPLLPNLSLLVLKSFFKKQRSVGNSCWMENRLSYMIFLRG